MCCTLPPGTETTDPRLDPCMTTILDAWKEEGLWSREFTARRMLAYCLSVSGEHSCFEMTDVPREAHLLYDVMQSQFLNLMPTSTP